MPPAPRTPAEHHYDLAESGLDDLGRVGFDDAGRTVEVLVALTHAMLAICAILADEDNHRRQSDNSQASPTG